MTSNEITEALKSVDYAIRLNAIRQPNVKSEHLTQALWDLSFEVRNAALHHKKIAEKHILQAMENDFYVIRSRAEKIMMTKFPWLVLEDRFAHWDKYDLLLYLIGANDDL